MRFVQTLSFTCPDEDALFALMTEWGEHTVGAIGYWQAVMMKDRDRPGAWVIWVEFPSHDEAMQNSNRPETDSYAARLRELVGDIEYRNFDLAGGSASVTKPSWA